MFDRTLIQTPAPSVHVHNETKPHDPADAARLYGELERLAREKTATATIERLGAENEITVAVVHQATDYLQMREKARVMFKLNGVQYDFEMDWDAANLAQEVAHAVVQQLLEKVRVRLLK